MIFIVMGEQTRGGSSEPRPTKQLALRVTEPRIDQERTGAEDVDSISGEARPQSFQIESLNACGKIVGATQSASSLCARAY